MAKKIPRIRIGPVGNAVLGVIAVSGVITAVALFPGVAHIIGPFLKKKKYSRNQLVSRNLESLIANGLIRRTKNANGDEVLELTTKGRFEAMIRHTTLTRKSDAWDGLWRVIIFDVPNSKGKVRNELRRIIKLFGFHQLQKSVWVYPYECDDFVHLLKSHLGAAPDVLYMKVQHIENQKHLMKEFKL